MKTTLRLILGAILPPLIGGIIFLLYAIPFTPSEIKDYILSALGILAFSYILMSWQSVLYAFAMEFLVLPNTNSKAITLLISTILGLISSLTLFILSKSFFLNEILIIITIGIVTGLAVGWVLFKLKPENNNSVKTNIQNPFD